jgi:hypothetical protein
MKTKYYVAILFLLILQSCVEDDNFPEIERSQYAIKTKILKSGVNITNRYNYAFGIDAVDTIIRPMFSKDFDANDPDFDSILPLPLNIFKDTSTFVLVDKSDLRDTVQVTYKRNVIYYNVYLKVNFSDMKVNFVSNRIANFNISRLSSITKADLILK